MTKILVTGGCGFIGHHFVEHLYKNTDWDIVIIDKLTYASKGFERIKNIGMLNDLRVKIFTFDLAQTFTEGIVSEMGDINYIVHMAAETHVDNSIDHPVPFIYNNVMSTVNLLEYARNLKNLKLFFYFSTDEVFGYAPENVAYKEWDRHKPTNPYSASKSAAENICIAYENTYKIPLIMVNVMNAFGERQHVEKFIPKVIKKVLDGEKVYIHSYEDKKTPGSRFYIHARNIADAVLFLIKNGKIGDKHNIVGEREVDNLELAQLIAKILDKPLNYELISFHKDRPGHDLRYCLDGTKMKELGWHCPVNFEESLKKTILWTLDNKVWLEE